ncbi:MAG: hypothetical protein PF549_04130 [Patescibacteria group bacterium]|jgi:hypothetical protein|nr:hypothetical protein [Patescibacteria group bacterium]
MHIEVGDELRMKDGRIVEVYNIFEEREIVYLLWDINKKEIFSIGIAPKDWVKEKIPKK